METLLSLVCLLVAVTLVGHGIWILVAMLLRVGQPPQLKPGMSCPRCGLPVVTRQCGACKWPQPATAPVDWQQGLRTLAAQIRGMQSAGVLDEATCQSLLATVEAERLRRAALERPAASPATQPAAEQAIEAEVVEETGAARPAPSPWQPSHAAVERPAPISVSERVATYAERQSAAQAGPPLAAAPPRRSWTDWLAAFMEERNMRWGELVGGLLIVCCSIALVISFWSEIEARPWLKFLLFNGVTASLFGVGFYSEHRWRLHTTSQGLLSIGCLLVPLNFLAIAALSSAPGWGELATIAGEALSALFFTVMVYFAGKVLIRRDAAWLTVGLMVPALAQLLVRRFIEPGVPPAMLWEMAAVPVGAYLAANLWHFRQVGQLPVVGERVSNGLFKFVGLTSFAVVLPLALLLYKSGTPIETLRQLPALAALVGSVPLCGGLLLWQRLAAGSLSGLRTAGASVAVFGAAVTLAGLGIGWPEPSGLLPAAAADFVIFSLVAWRFGMPAVHLLAAPCLALAYLLAAHLGEGAIAFSGNGPELMQGTLISGESGTLLAPLVLAYAGAALVARRRAMAAQRPWTFAAAGLMAVSVALATWYGFGYPGDPLGVGWVYLLYAALCLAVAARQRTWTASWAGSVLLLAGVVQEVVFRSSIVWELGQACVTAFLVYCTVSGAIAIIGRRIGLVIQQSLLPHTMWRGAAYISFVAAAGLVLFVPLGAAGLQAIYWSWLAIVWLAVGMVVGWMPLWTLFQLALVAATTFGVVAALALRPWFAATRWPWLDPWTLQAIGLALVGVSALWTVVRLACRGPWNETRWAALLASRWLSIDRVTTVFLVGVLAVLSLTYVLPDTLAEISPAGAAVGYDAHFPVPEAARMHAGDWGSWALAGGLCAVLMLVLRERPSRWWLAVLMVTTATAIPLAAGWFAPSRAVATAMVWLSVAYLAVGSMKIWSRRWLGAGLAHLGWPALAADAVAWRDATALVLFIGLVAPVTLGITIAAQAIDRTVPGAFGSDLAIPLVVGATILVVGLALWSRSESQGAPRSVRADWPGTLPGLAVWLAVVPAVAYCTYQVAAALVRSPIAGPDANSLFGRLGWPAACGIPAGVVAAVLVGYALRERSARFALAGGLAAGAVTTLVSLLVATRAVTDAALWVRLAQANTAVAAVYTLTWIGIAAWGRRGRRWGFLARGAHFRLQAVLAPAITALLLGWAWAQLVTHPVTYPFGPVVLPEVADAWGCTSVALVAVAAAASARAARRRLSRLEASGLLVALVVLAAGIAARWDAANWLAYNTLYVGHALAAVVLLALAWRETRKGAPAALQANGHATNNNADMAPTGAMWPLVQLAIVVLLALREMNDNAWWTVGGWALSGAVLAPALAWIFAGRRYLYLAAVLVDAAGLLAVDELGWITGPLTFVYWNAVFLAAPVAGWLAVERLGIERCPLQPRVAIPPVHRIATRAAAVLVVVPVAIGLAADALQQATAVPAVAVDWVALGAAVAAALACLWDARARDAIATLYVLGLAACATLLHRLQLSPEWLLSTGTIVVAAYALGTSYLWSRRRGVMELAARLRVPLQRDAELAGLVWLVPLNVLLIVSVVAMTALVELSNPRLDMRILAAQATLVQVFSLALLARGDHRGVLQMGALAIGAVGAVFFGWAWLEPHATFTLLHALVVVAAATAAVAAFYGLALAKLLSDTSDWLPAARRMTPVLAVASGAAILATLGLEVWQYIRTGEVLIAWPAIVVVGLTFAASSMALLAAAVLPGRDPLNLSERGRTAYVYAAELMLALLFVHVRVTAPWLFSGFFQQFWPLIVMAIAYLGVGSAELFRRRQQHVLSRPLENTGALLPVLPVVGYWAADSRIDYSLLLLCVGLLYGGLSIARRSFGFGVLAAVAANGGLWFFLNRQDGWGFLAHPQVWLIPPAVCILVAAYLNRRQLSEAQMTAIRYATSMAIYISSTADIFINGVAEAPMLPVLLAGLSILGIVAGIMLRVRAFLFLGTGFLALSMFTVIWFAAVDREQTWIWWATGIVAGILIMMLVGIFEKKRQQVLDVFDRIKQWEA